jgi:hypothetical protein
MSQIQFNKQTVKNIYGSINSTWIPKEVLLPYWAHRDISGTKGDRVHVPLNIQYYQLIMSRSSKLPLSSNLQWTFRIPCTNMLPPIRTVVCTAHVYQVILYKMPPCSQLKQRVQDKSDIITNFTLNLDYFPQIYIGWHVPPKRPYECDTKRFYYTEECNLN